MTSRTRTGLLVGLAVALTSCGGGGSSSAPASSPTPTAPTPVAAAATLVVFTDPASGFSTTDVRDNQEQIVRFNTADELIWTADGTRFPGYRANGNFLRFDSNFEVVFATRAGERRAYFTLHGHGAGDPNRLCDIEVVGGRLVITETNVPMCSPQSSGPCS